MIEARLETVRLKKGDACIQRYIAGGLDPDILPEKQTFLKISSRKPDMYPFDPAPKAYMRKNLTGEVEPGRVASVLPGRADRPAEIIH